jgi:hypothetical protein
MQRAGCRRPACRQNGTRERGGAERVCATLAVGATVHRPAAVDRCPPVSDAQVWRAHCGKVAFVWSANQAGEPHNTAYFWLTGLVSAVLDNAPTYPVFFDLAGGNAARLTGELAPTLAAISMGAVYMGALTYLGNAPNFMIYVIASERGVKMPSLWGFMMWSGAVLLPVVAVVT